MRAFALPARGRGDHVLAVTSVALLGYGAVAVAMGGMSGSGTLSVSGGVVAGAALMALLAAGWLDGIVLVLLSLALPAPYASESLRLAPAAAATAAAVCAWYCRRALDREPIEPHPFSAGASVCLLVAVLLSTLFAQHVGIALRELVNWMLLLGFFVMATVEVGDDARRPRRLALLIAGITAVSGALAVLQATGAIPGRFPWGGSYHRATLGFQWPNELGMFLAIGLPFSVHAVRAARGRVPLALAGLGLAASLLGLVATFSRGSWVAVLAASLVLLACGGGRFVLGVWLSGLLAAVAIDAVSGGVISGRITNPEGLWVVGQRLSLMLSGVLMFRSHPLLGVGPGGFGESLERFGARIPSLWDYTGSAHNLYVHMAAETGLVGLVALLAFLGACFLVLVRGARRAHNEEETGLRRALLWSFATACFVGLFEWTFVHGVGQLIVLVAAMGFALEKEGVP